MLQLPRGCQAGGHKEMSSINSALVYESKCGRRGGGVAGLSQWVQPCITWHGAQINFGDLPPYLSYVVRRFRMRGEGGIAGPQPMSTAVHITWHGAQINFGDLHCKKGSRILTYVVRRVLRAGTDAAAASRHHLTAGQGIRHQTHHLIPQDAAGLPRRWDDRSSQ